jgi:hypothetical protein
MFMRSAQPWLRSQALSGAECHEMSPPDFRPLAETWRAMWPEFFLPK